VANTTTMGCNARKTNSYPSPVNFETVSPSWYGAKLYRQRETEDIVEILKKLKYKGEIRVTFILGHQVIRIYPAF
jgi:hypothetical protein